MVSPRKSGSQARDSLGRNLTRGVVEQLGKLIVTGHFDDRPFPNEAGIETEFQVSHTVVREAMKMLTVKGLVSARPRQGTIVRSPENWNLYDNDVLRWTLNRRFSLDLLRQFTELRLAIEPNAARFAAINADTSDLDHMRAMFDQMARAELGEGDPLQADIDFHISILEATGNSFYRQLKDLVATALVPSIRFTTRLRGVTASLEFHEDIMRSIIDKKADDAHDKMFRVVNDVLIFIRAETSKPDSAPVKKKTNAV